MKYFCLLCLLCFAINKADSKNYYLSSSGSDSYPGSINFPFKSFNQAQNRLLPGDTLFIRGGNYEIDQQDIMLSYPSRIFAIVLYKSGNFNNYINYCAYPGEHPIFDFSKLKSAHQRIIGFMVTGNWIHLKGIEIIGVQVYEKGHTQSESIENTGSRNIYENLSMHDSQAIGFYLINGSNNLILNCDAYNNHDYTSENKKGGNTDGFGCHGGTGSHGNVFRGCRAWFNSDDGFDCINSGESVTFDHCWAFYNGFDSKFNSLADGNGFKAGGYGQSRLSRIPLKIPRHHIQFCLAVQNKANGFYANHHLNGDNWINNSACYNSINFNLLNRKRRNSRDYLTDIDGYSHILKNNLAYHAKRKNIDHINNQLCHLENNDFDLQNQLNQSDFISLDENLLRAPRKKDGSLPDIGFMKLKETTNLTSLQEVGYKPNKLTNNESQITKKHSTPFRSSIGNQLYAGTTSTK